VNGNGNHEVCLHLIGNGKHDPSYQQREWNCRENGVCEHKCGRAYEKSDHDAPPSEKSIEHSPKKDSAIKSKPASHQQSRQQRKRAGKVTLVFTPN